MSKPDKLTQNILDFMVPLGAGKSCSISENWDHEADASIGQLCEAVGASKDETLAGVAYLVKKDLAEYRQLNSRRGPVAIGFRLKHEGIHHKEFQRLTQREKWIERAYGFFSALALWAVTEIIVRFL